MESRRKDDGMARVGGWGFLFLFFIFLLLSTSRDKVLAGPVRIAMKDRAFSPETVRIHVGDTVEWVNDDHDVHLVISGRELQDKSLGKPLDSGTLMPGQHYSYTFTKPGVYPFMCVIHWMQSTTGAPMKGEVIVEP